MIIKLKGYQTQSFRYVKGVRQGCVLNPLLFNLYLNQLPVSLEQDNQVLYPNGYTIIFEMTFATNGS